MLMKKPEILAPAGSFESLRAAVIAGADAVYLGGNRFGARAYADNFDEQTLIQGIEYCHMYGVKVYLTVNTLFHNEEISELYDFLLPLYLAGLDAVIVQDFGVLSYVHQYFPDLSVHASTQMTITTGNAYPFLKEFGVKRIVPARELSLDELVAMKQTNNPPELEVFVQGAICYCYSGQCLMSSFIGGRSGNRGRCAQPCRLPYQIEIENANDKERYILSPKDLCGLSDIGNLIEAGVDSFKIEGRMKKPLYVASCVRAYRNAVDAWFDEKLTDDLMQEYKIEMASAFNRGGFTDGYYHRHNGKDMMTMTNPKNSGVLIGEVISKGKYQLHLSLTTEVQNGDILIINENQSEIQLTCNQKAKKGENISLNVPSGAEITAGAKVYRVRNKKLDDELEKMIAYDKKIPVQGELHLHTGTPASLVLKYKNFTISETGNIVEKAIKQPITKQLAIDKISQLGETKYVFSDLQAFVSADAFYSVKDMKELRRNAFLSLEKEIVHFYQRKVLIKKEEKVIHRKEKEESREQESPIVEISAFVQFEAIKSYEKVKNIYIDLQYFDKNDIMKLLKENKNYNFWIVLPAIFRDECRNDLDYVVTITEDNLIGLVVKNIDELAYLKDMHYAKDMVADVSLYAMNDYAADFLNMEFTVPVELNQKEILNLSSENKMQMVVYGYQQLMVSAQCMLKNTSDCKMDNQRMIFKDRYQNDFYTKAVCKYCYNLIYNGLPTVIFDMDLPIFRQKKIRHRLHFTLEDKEDTLYVLRCYFENEKFLKKHTKGHMKRGVE